MTLEELQPNLAVRGILPDALVTVINVQWYGDNALELTYKDPGGRVSNEVLYRADEGRLQVADKGKPWSFDGDGKLFRLVAEAHRIRLAHLFDPVLAVHTSLVEPLPHQITAVYEEMLPRQPLRFLLADDPGAGKTIVAGLLMKEMIARGDLQRCLVVCPGSLAEQWQDDLYRRFHLKFDILTNDKLEASAAGNWFRDTSLAIARLDKLSRNDEVQAKLLAPDAQWDLVVCDEAHKMSATFSGGEVSYTKRYKLGQLLSGITRHFLLMTATPHNGKEEDFQLFMALLDGDRFEGKFRDGVHVTDVSDLMRRMVKEKLLKFDGRPLFPPRIATTVPYKLSDAEAQLYKAVTDYVRQEWRKADNLKKENDTRANTVGFALTMLQRRLASSPEAIYQSLRRRRERLEKKLREVELMHRAAMLAGPAQDVPELDEDDIDALDDAADDEIEQVESEVLDQATAARTAEELRAEIASLLILERTANDVRRSGDDRKWVELSGLLHQAFQDFPAALSSNRPEAGRAQRAALGGGAPSATENEPASALRTTAAKKLVIFTEHRDTLSYLQDRIARVIGGPETVKVIHGSMGREDRMAANPGSVLLLDEPDAHLEILRQRQIYQLLSDTAAETGSQVIAASHSEVILNEAADRDTVVAFVGRPHRIDDRGSQVLKALKEIGFDQYVQAEETGWVLYLEGSTDLAILRAFAAKLGHPAAAALERVFVHYVANQPMKAQAHFHGLRKAKRDLVGIALYDRLDSALPAKATSPLWTSRRRPSGRAWRSTPAFQKYSMPKASPSRCETRSRSSIRCSTRPSPSRKATLTPTAALRSPGSSSTASRKANSVSPMSSRAPRTPACRAWSTRGF